MADMTNMQARIRELEARRAKGESVPELDALYEKMDALTNKAHAEATRSVTGETAKPVKKAKGGTASARADGCAQRGKTRGKFV